MQALLNYPTSLRTHRNTAIGRDTSARNHNNLFRAGDDVGNILQLTMVLFADFLDRHGQVGQASQNEENSGPFIKVIRYLDISVAESRIERLNIVVYYPRFAA